MSDFYQYGTTYAVPDHGESDCDAYYEQIAAHHLAILDSLAQCKAHTGIIGGLPMSDRIMNAAIALEAEAHRLAALARAVQEAG
jgi:hypothetical protein